MWIGGTVSRLYYIGLWYRYHVLKSTPCHRPTVHAQRVPAVSILLTDCLTAYNTYWYAKYGDFNRQQNVSLFQGCPQDVKSQDRDVPKNVSRPRGSRPRLHPWSVLPHTRQTSDMFTWLSRCTNGRKSPRSKWKWINLRQEIQILKKTAQTTPMIWGTCVNVACRQSSDFLSAVYEPTSCYSICPRGHIGGLHRVNSHRTAPYIESIISNWWMSPSL